MSQQQECRAGSRPLVPTPALGPQSFRRGARHGLLGSCFSAKVKLLEEKGGTRGLWPLPCSFVDTGSQSRALAVWILCGLHLSLAVCPSGAFQGLFSCQKSWASAVLWRLASVSCQGSGSGALLLEKGHCWCCHLHTQLPEPQVNVGCSLWSVPGFACEGDWSGQCSPELL